MRPIGRTGIFFVLPLSTASGSSARLLGKWTMALGIGGPAKVLLM
jgi:hypothetical protein